MPDIAPQVPKVPAAGVREEREMSRRRALAKLGLAATVVYAAPSVLHLDRSYAATKVSCPAGTKWHPSKNLCI